MLIIGIDPGAKGGIAIIPLYAFAQTQIYALEHHSLSDLCHIFEEIRHGSHDLEDQAYRKDTQVEVFLEEPKLPGTHGFGVNVHRELGRSVGQMEGVCIAQDWQPELISPRKWQGGLDCMTGGDKNISLGKAQACFPFLYARRTDGTPYSKITHAVADALLIALYGYLHYAHPTKLPHSVKKNISVECRDKIMKKASKEDRTIKSLSKDISTETTRDLTTLLELETKGTNNGRKRPYKPQRRP